MGYLNIKKSCHIYLASVMALLLGACSNVDYISREDLKNSKYDGSKSVLTKSTDYGAFKFKKKKIQKSNLNDDVQDAQNLYFNEEKDDGRLYILQKKKGAYQIETKFYENKNKSYFFSLGLDYKNKAPRVGFRLEF